MDNLTVVEVSGILKSCTYGEIMDVLEFESAEEMLLSLEDFIEANLDNIVNNMFTDGLVEGVTDHG